MMIILSKKEYNDLVQKAGGIEAQVEIRVEEEKQKILEKLRHGFMERTKDFRFSPAETMRSVINEVLG